jgi:hypothetical protein
MLNKGSNVVRKGSKRCIPTLLVQYVLADNTVLETYLEAVNEN